MASPASTTRRPSHGLRETRDHESRATEAGHRIGRGGDVRREAILDAATKLFSVRGFTETGIDEIGEAVGITGPAVYRYFDVQAGPPRRGARPGRRPRRRRCRHGSATRRRRPTTRCDGWSSTSWRSCIEDRSLTALYWHEARNLPPGPRRRIERTQRKAVDDYAVILRELRPELTDSEARMAVYAASALMRSVANRETSLDEARLHRLLSSMAYASLDARVARLGLTARRSLCVPEPVGPLRLLRIAPLRRPLLDPRHDPLRRVGALTQPPDQLRLPADRVGSGRSVAELVDEPLRHRDRERRGVVRDVVRERLRGGEHVGSRQRAGSTGPTRRRPRR